MIVKEIELTKENAKKYLSSYASGLVNNMGAEVVGAYIDNEDDLSAVAVISSEDDLESNVVHYIYLRDNEDIETLNKLMGYVELLFVERGFDDFSISMICDNNRADALIPMLTEFGAELRSLDKRYIMYSVKTIQASDFGKTVAGNTKMVKQVYCYNELNSAQIRDYKKLLAGLDTPMDFPEADLVFGRFFIVDGAIAGHLNISEFSDGVLVMTDSYVKKDKTTVYAIPLMLSGVVNTVFSFLPEDSTVHFTLDTEKLLEAFIKVFGQPDSNEILLECSKTI